MTDNAAAHLDPGGAFVVEVRVPDLRRLPPGETARVVTDTPHRLGYDVYEVAVQGLVSHHYRRMDGGRLQGGATPFRHVWPAELDLMAALAGMHLEERWSGWRREPFTAESTRHVSVWRTPG